MCGITALFGPLASPEAVQAATDALVHRGPDAQGVWLDPDAPLALGHRRLSILDLSPTGAQPMHSADGRWVMVFNGEIYNFPALRQRVTDRGLTLRGRSDTEILLEHAGLFGLPETLERAVGMFALALWDRREQRLFIARDRCGEKPLYYGRNAGTWILGSELKALAAVPGATWSLDPATLALYLRHGYVPEPHAVYEHTRKLPPGHWAELRADGSAALHRYWDFATVVRQGRERPFTGSLDEAAEELRALLDESVRLQRVADVPVGAFLSGGVDSSTVAALMKRQGGEVVTFSIAFQEEGFDESAHAAAVARHLGTRHVERPVSPQDARDLIPQLPRIFDEPFGDASMIPTVLVSRVAREQVTVALSGDAGDELFGGYNRYHALAHYWGLRQGLPLKPGTGLARLLGTAATMGGRLGCDAAYALGRADLARRFLRRADWFAVQDVAAYYQRFQSYFFHAHELLRRPPKVEDPLPHFADFGPGESGSYAHAMAVDSVTYLPGDILTKVDRAAMSCSLETRVPFLDHRVVEWAWRLPVELRITPRETKRVLRQVLYAEVPRELLERPKMGFGCPVGHWVRGPLRQWAEDLLSPALLRRQGLLRPERVQAFWREHRDGAVNQEFALWPLLMLQAWLTEHGF